MKLKIGAGSTSRTAKIFVQDSSSTTGAGLTGLAYNTSGLTWYYIREGDSSATAVTMVTATLGTFTSSGFVVCDGTNLPGFYEIGIPNAALASGAKSVHMLLKGATNMVPVAIEIELDAVNYQDSVRLGLTALPNAAASAVGGLPVAVDTSGRVDVLKINGTSQTARDIGASVLLSSGTGTGQLSLSSGAVIVQSGTGTGQISLSSGKVSLSSSQTFDNTGTWTGNLSGSVGSVTSGVNVTNINGSPDGPTGLALLGEDYGNGNVSNDSGWGAGIAAQAWDAATRTLTAGTNIVLAKGTGITGFNDITAASVASLILVTPANKLTTDASGNVTFANTSIATVTTLTNLPAAPTDWLTAAAVKADAVTKIQSGLATPTNITAGTITTVSGNVAGSVGSISGITFPTNFSVLSISATTGLVTFANTTIGVSGDFSATMKTSLNAATPTASLAANQHVIVDSGTVTTLTTLPTAPTDWLSAAAVSSAAVTKIQSGLSTLSAAGVWSILTSSITTTGSIGVLLKAMGADFATMTSGSGTGSAKFTATALSLAPTGGGGGTTNVTIVPITSTVSTGQVISENITAYVGEAKTITFVVVDGTGAPIPGLDSADLEFVATAPSTPQTPVFTHASGGDGITVAGTDNNNVTVQCDTSDTPTATTYDYALWNRTTNLVLAKGKLFVQTVAQQT